MDRHRDRLLPEPCVILALGSETLDLIDEFLRKTFRPLTNAGTVDNRKAPDDPRPALSI
jgi:hypothetical protein